MKIAFMYSGQGAQYAGMGKELYNYSKTFKNVLDQTEGIFDFSIKDTCFEENDKLDNTAYTQPCLLTISTACTALLKEEGIRPSCLLGLSLGEYTALVNAEVFTLEEGLQLVHKRGTLMNEAVPEGMGAMFVIMGGNKDIIEEVCQSPPFEGKVFPTNYNSPQQIVISGEAGPCEAAAAVIKDKGAKRVIPVKVRGPFHTPFLKEASLKLEAALNRMNVKDLKLPVVSNYTGDFIPSKEEIVSFCKNQMISPVLWEKSIRLLLSEGFDTFIELGPSKTLSSFVKAIDKSVTILNVEDVKSFEKTMTVLKKVKEC